MHVQEHSAFATKNVLEEDVEHESALAHAGAGHDVSAERPNRRRNTDVLDAAGEFRGADAGAFQERGIAHGQGFERFEREAAGFDQFGVKEMNQAHEFTGINQEPWSESDPPMDEPGQRWGWANLFVICIRQVVKRPATVLKEVREGGERRQIAWG